MGCARRTGPLMGRRVFVPCGVASPSLEVEPACLHVVGRGASRHAESERA